MLEYICETCHSHCLSFPWCEISTFPMCLLVHSSTRGDEHLPKCALAHSSTPGDKHLPKCALALQPSSFSLQRFHLHSVFTPDFPWLWNPWDKKMRETRYLFSKIWPKFSLMVCAIFDQRIETITIHSYKWKVHANSYRLWSI